MGKSDVEMEDAEKNDQVSRDNIEGSESKVLDTKIEDKREEFPSAATVAGDSNKSVNGGEDLIKLENETENKITGGSEMEDQMKPESKNSEPMDIEGSNGEQINTGSKNEEQSSTEAKAKEQISTDANAKEQNSTNANAEEQTSTDANAEQQTSSDANAKEQTSTDANAKEQTSTEANAEGQTSTEANAEEKTAAGGTMDKQIDARNELVEQNTTNDGPREESFTKNGVEGGNLVKNVQENPSGDGAAEKFNDTGRGDGDAEAEKPTDTVKEEGDAAAEKPIHTGREDGDGAAEKLNDTGRGGGDAEAEKPTDTEMEEGDAAAEKPIDTGREDGDAAAEKPIDTGREDGDAAAEKPKDTEREEGDSIEQVTKKEMANENANTGNDPTENRQFPTELASKKATQNQNAALDKVPKSEDIEMAYATDNNEDKSVNDEPKEQGKKIHLAGPVTETLETATKRESDASSLPNQHEAATPSFILRNTSAKAGENSAETNKSVFTQAALPLTAEGDDGTPEEQAAFMKEIESFYREKAMDFKPPKFYGQPLNCLKLWRAVIRLGGYDRVTGAKLWRQVGESFHPPKTCTTVSWTFRIFYEKSLLEYERHKRQSGELQLPVVTAPEASGADSEGNGYQGSGGPGRARRDAAARAMQGWHVQRLFDNGEVGEPVIKDKNLNNMSKQKNVKSIVSLKQKRPNEVEQSVKDARTESSKQLVTSVVDVGPPADWVKINIRQTKDCFEVYALVPGLLREEVRVQSDPAGRLVITGQPEQVDNPWGITPFKKVVSLPARIDPLQTSAVVSLHGRLVVRVPFEKSTS